MTYYANRAERSPRGRLTETLHIRVDEPRLRRIDMLARRLGLSRSDAARLRIAGGEELERLARRSVERDLRERNDDSSA